MHTQILICTIVRSTITIHSIQSGRNVCFTTIVRQKVEWSLNFNYPDSAVHESCVTICEKLSASYKFDCYIVSWVEIELMLFLYEWKPWMKHESFSYRLTDARTRIICVFGQNVQLLEWNWPCEWLWYSGRHSNPVKINKQMPVLWLYHFQCKQSNVLMCLSVFALYFPANI